MVGPSAQPKQAVKQLVGAPVMITLPGAYLVARLFTDYVGFPNLLYVPRQVCKLLRAVPILAAV